MVTEDCYRTVAKPLYEAQDLQRIGATINKVTGKPQLVFLEVKIEFIQQSQQIVKATLNITDGIGCPWMVEEIFVRGMIRDVGLLLLLALQENLWGNQANN